MAIEEPETTANKPASPAIGGSPWVFWGPQGLRAGWSVLLFLLLIWFFSFALANLLGHLHVPATLELGYAELLEFLPTLAATGVMALMIEKRPLTLYGFGRPVVRHFISGATTGFGSLSILLLALGITGHYSTGGLAIHGREIAAYAAIWGITFLLVGLFEETFFRGYALATFTRGMGFWPAAILLSLLFGAGHIKNPQEDWFGAVSAALFGFMFCLSIRRTGSLWWAVGFHSMWDYSQSFIYSTADSGQVFPGHLLNARFSGPSWITGGDVGPEGSVFILPLLVAIAGVIHLTYPSKKYPAKEIGPVDTLGSASQISEHADDSATQERT